MTTSEMATVLAWHDALNEGDLDTLERLSSNDIEIGDPGGAVQGHAALREWARACPLRAEVGRVYVRGGTVVVEQTVTGADGRTDTAAAAFHVSHDHVTSVFRHPDLATALAVTELTEEDLVG
ncbi:nuclear transport factor 2 family protein [uncultured Mycolicibacterium sp.]|jgi:hypothetical protein|uniref:nuclear transport factor 2 family protein n=1 Tax=uncultured Mycolicibacterium sp. TaxID=2320817 RepID=UPI0026192CC4|nr:nuclear transport factor 2 family protein [uncultured Mycolicibacterium sp.]